MMRDKKFKIVAASLCLACLVYIIKEQPVWANNFIADSITWGFRSLVNLVEGAYNILNGEM